MRNLLRVVYIRFTQAKCCSARLAEKWELGARGVGERYQGLWVSALARLRLDAAKAKKIAPKKRVQDRIAETRIKRTPAAGPPLGTTAYAHPDGRMPPKRGRTKLAGAIYKPTASRWNKEAAPNESTASAIAASTPMAMDLKT